MKFLLLKSVRDNGKVIKVDNRKHYEYDKKEGWIRSGIMSDYYLPYGVCYDMFEEITEEEANKIIGNM